MNEARGKWSGAAKAQRLERAQGEVILTVDLDKTGVRDFNHRLHRLAGQPAAESFYVINPKGRHSICAGVNAPVTVTIDGHVGYYAAGMCQQAEITINGNAGKGLAENMMSGTVRLRGNASEAAGATGHGGLLVIEGDAGARCGISMKGIDIVVKGSVGHFSAFMAQAGHLVVCGDAAHSLGDSIYEAVIFVQGRVAELGADCIEKDMTPAHLKTLRALLERAGIDADPKAFRRFGSARKLYNFHMDHADAY